MKGYDAFTLRQYSSIIMDNIKSNEAFIQTVAVTSREKAGQVLLKSATPKQLDALCEIILNVLRGTVPLAPCDKKKASQHKTVLRKLAKRCLKKLPRKKLFIKYFKVIRSIIIAALPVIGIIISAVQLQ